MTNEYTKEREGNRARMAHMLGMLRPDMNGMELLVLDNRICEDAVVADWRFSQIKDGVVSATAYDYVKQATPQERNELRQRIAG